MEAVMMRVPGASPFQVNASRCIAFTPGQRARDAGVSIQCQRFAFQQFPRAFLGDLKVQAILGNLGPGTQPIGLTDFVLRAAQEPLSLCIITQGRDQAGGAQQQIAVIRP
jgi:hypothetical protein